MQSGRIIKALAGFYYVEYNGALYQTRARGLFRKTEESPIVGDFVDFQIENETDGYITNIHDRKNELKRPTVANIDQVIVTMSLKSPEFSFYLLDRFLAYVEAHDIRPIIVVTKLDLLEDESLIDTISDTYDEIYPIYFTDQNEINTDLLEIFEDKVTVLAGQSGVGKSSLLNTLLPELALKTDDISKSLNRGKHTTRHVELVKIGGGLIADTPGFSTIEFSDIDKYNIKYCFKEFNDYQNACKFRECMHISEPQCKVREALKSGDIKQSRYDSYIAIFKEIENRKERY